MPSATVRSPRLFFAHQWKFPTPEALDLKRNRGRLDNSRQYTEDDSAAASRQTSHCRHRFECDPSLISRILQRIDARANAFVQRMF
ncbi:hypothetical protein AB1N83_013130 [Pleurotus pulmonarius]